MKSYQAYQAELALKKLIKSWENPKFTVHARDNFNLVDLEIVDKTALTIFLLSEIPCYSGIFMISFVLV